MSDDEEKKPDAQPVADASVTKKTKKRTTELSVYELAFEGWDFPSFARKFPREATLDALVLAYARGDFKTVNEGAPKLAQTTEDEAVKSAALLLVARTQPDPAAKVFFALTAVLLAFLTFWWVTHDGPPKDTPAPTKPVPTVEYVN